MSGPAAPASDAQLTREDLAAMKPVDRLAAHKAGRTKSLLTNGGTSREGRRLGALGVAEAEAILTAAKATRQAH